MKSGDRISCPHCGEDTFVKRKILMDGWTKQGEVLVCALCGKKLSDAEDCSDSAAGSADISALQSLLGGETLEKTSVSLNRSDCRFCKDCAHAVRNAFVFRCELTGNEVDSMGDCGRFRRREESREQ